MEFMSRTFRGVPELESAAVSNTHHVVEGACGDHVGLIQQALIALDGAVIARAELAAKRYGPTTANAVLRYKEKRGIINFSYQTSADDIVGEMTIAALDKGMARLERSIRAHRLRCSFDGQNTA